MSIVVASDAKAQYQSVKEVEANINSGQISIAEVFAQIESTTDFNFYFHIKDVNANKLILIPKQQGTVADILESVSKQAKLKFRQVNNNISVTKVKKNESYKPVLVALADVDLTGKVTDENGEGLPGASVLVKGTTNGTITDLDGNYSLTAPEDAIIVISFVGYKSQELSIGGRSTLDVQLEVDAEQLDEVVVVGYGTQRKVDLTGAVGSISSADIVNKPIVSADQALAGRIAGVQITNRSGDPGAPINVRIRGVGTTGNNQPLWVIDGIPMVLTNNFTATSTSTDESNPLMGINPNDIESIDVLKDASAAAIYGARAANGVIIVTTKRGKKGERMTLSYDGYTGISQVRKKWDVLNTEQYIDLHDELGSSDFSQFRGQPFVDWQDAVFRDAQMQSHNVSIGGGTENANFNISGSYLLSEGIEPSQQLERYTFKVNSDINAGKRFKFGESLLVSFTDRNSQNQDVALTGSAAAKNAPWYPVYGDGPFGYSLTNDDIVGDANGTNFLLLNDKRVGEQLSKPRKILGNVYGEVKLIEGLKYRLSAGIDYNIGQDSFFTAGIDTDGQPGDDTNDVLIVRRGIELTTNIANTLTYTKQFGDHSLTAMIGHEETNFEYENIGATARNLVNSDLKLLILSETQQLNSEADHWALRGFLGRINYAYKDKYLFTANVRRDFSSRLSSDNRGDIFPSFSLGWRLSNESFFPKSDFISDVKVRASWGQSGNQFTGVNFAYQSTLALTPHYVVGAGQNVVRAPVPIRFANRDLKWETSTQIDIGTDISLLEGALDLTFDYYQKETQDILVSLPIPSVSGYFLPAEANAGTIKNSGIELDLQYRGRAGDFTYSIGGNITTVKNEVVDLAQAEIITGVGGGQTHRTIEGEAIGHFYGYVTDGIFQTQSEVDAAVPDVNSSERAPGDIRFVDVNGDGEINAEDRTNLGDPIPDYFYGINLSAGYKGFDLSVLLQGVGGYQIYNQVRRSFEDMYSYGNQSTAVLDRWTPENPSTSMPRAHWDDPNNNRRYSDRWIEDGDHLRIRNIQLGYTIPTSLLSSVFDGFITYSRFYVSVQNLATFTNYSGFDPEVTRGTSFQKGDFTLATGQDSGYSPQPRVFQVGWQVKF
ncbi:MAG: TonB-dependent receptor [Reichenbachiella sp.]|uniref:SusC/RagA family TonB-linked outer membrane protein n=2 Tax=Reichenbachiella sp. TaxID=2184521 RepID=UPI0032669312